MDERETVTFCNPAFARIFEAQPNELVGKNLLDFCDWDARCQLPRETERRRNNEVSTYELSIITARGERKHLRVTASPRFAEDGTYIGAFVALLDITNRKQAEEELRESREKLQRTMEGTIYAMARALETRDPYTAGHQRRVAQIAKAIAEEMNLPADRVNAIHLAAMIHDIGKINVPTEILSKPGELSEYEADLIRIHPQVGYDLLHPIEFPWPIDEIVLQHHERMDGSGYPNGLKGDEIILEARILGVADVVEAMSSHRPYRSALGMKNALREISRNKGILYDPDVVEACIRVIEANHGALE